MALLAVMAALSILMAFTDSVTTETEGGQKTTYYGLVLRDGLWSPTLNYYCRLSHITEGGDSERASLLGDSVSRTCPLCRQTQKDRIDRQKQKAKEKNKGKQPEAAEEGLEDQAAEPANLQDIREFVLKEARYKRNISDWMHAVLTCACPTQLLHLPQHMQGNVLLTGHAALYGDQHLILLRLLSLLMCAYKPI